MARREAKKVLTGVKNKGAFLAWQLLHKMLRPEVEALQGIVLADLSELVNQVSKNPQANLVVR